MQIDEATKTTLRETWQYIKPELPRILSGFYKHVMQTPALARMIGDRTATLTSAQGKHWERLFTNGFDQAYVQSVRTIGLTHNRIGLEPRWYIGGYNYVMRDLSALIIRKNRWSTDKAAASIGEIGRQVGESARIMTEAVSHAEDANTQIQGLAAAAQKIGDVVKLISGIAGQTDAAAQTGNGAGSVVRSVEEVNSRSNRLREEIEQFFARIKVA